MRTRILYATRRAISALLICVTFSSSVLPTFAQDKLPSVYEGANNYYEEGKDALSVTDMQNLLERLSSEYKPAAVDDILSEPSKEYVEKCEGVKDISFNEYEDVSLNLPLVEITIEEIDSTNEAISNEFIESSFLQGRSKEVSANSLDELSPFTDVSGEEVTPVNMVGETTNQESNEVEIKIIPRVNTNLNKISFEGFLLECTIGDTENITRVVVSVPGNDYTIEPSIEDIKESGTFSLDNPIADVEKDKPYVFLVEAYYEKEITESESGHTVSEGDGSGNTYRETTIKRSYSVPFMIHEVKRGEKVKSISKNTGAEVKSIKEDNKIGIFSPKVGSVLFLRNVETNYEEPFAWTDEAVLKIQNMGLIKGCEYAYGLINLATLSLLYDEEDFSVTEKESFSLIRYFRSELTEIKGCFGRGVSSLFDECVIDMSDDGKLFITQDYKGVFLTREDNSFKSKDKTYTLIETADGMILNERDGQYRKFSSEGTIIERGTKRGFLYKIEYDENDNPISINTIGGKRFLIETNRAGLIEKITNPDLTYKKYTYNEDKLLSKVTNERGYDSLYEYDSSRRLVSSTDQMGKTVFKVNYDLQGKVLSYEDAKGSVSSFSANGNETTFTDAKNVTTKYIKDEGNRHIKVIYSDGLKEEREYNEASDILTFIDKSGNITKYEFNENGFCTKETDAAGLCESFVFDRIGNLLSETNANGNKTTYSYDANNNLIKTIYPDSTYTEMTFDSLGRLTSLKNTEGNITLYEYQGETFNVSRITDPKGNSTINTYDQMDRVLTTSTNALTTSYTYSETGKILSKTDPNGKTESYEYDACDNSIGVTDPMGNKVSIRYDSLGRITQVINADNTHTDFSYDANGNLIKEVSSTGIEKTYTYSENDELIGESSSAGESIKYERDSLGRVTKETYEDGSTVTYEYHKTLNLITKKKDQLDREITYEYDNVGNLLKETLSNGLFAAYTYDSNNRKTSVLDEKGIKTEYTYDSAGRITKEVESKDGKSREKEYEYDSNGNLIKETDFEGAYLKYAYDSENRLIKVTDSLGYTTEYTYGATGEMLSEKDRNGNVTKLEYDGNGNLIKKVDAEGNVYKYAYDSEDRIVMSTSPDGTVTGAVYNLEGYLAKKIDAYGNIEEYTFDDNGNVTSIKKADGSKSTYTYDSKNRKIKEVSPTGLVTQYKYNKLGWLVKVIYDNATSDTYTYDYNGNVVKIDYASGANELFEYSKDGVLLKSRSKEGIETSFYHDTFLNLIGFSNTKGENEEYVLNKNGKVTRKTDAMGNSIAYTYDGRGALIKTEESDGFVREMTYDGNENVISVKEFVTGKNSISSNDVSANSVSANDVSQNNCQERITRMEYDSNGNVIRTVYPNGIEEKAKYDYRKNVVSQTDKNQNTTTFTYDANGNLKTRTTPLGNTYTYGYDSVGNLSFERDPNENTESYTYNSLGKRTSVTYKNGAKSTYEYNNEGFLVKEIDPLKNEITHEYDLFGNEIKVTYPSGVYITKSFDALGRVLSEKDIYGLETKYKYDIDGKILQRTVQVPKYNIGNGISEDISFNNTIGASNSTVSNNTDLSLRDVSSNKGLIVSATTELDSITTSYLYDSFNRLIKEETEGLIPKEYVYDKKGRITKEIYGNTFIKKDYDEWGNLYKESDSSGLTIVYEYDIFGNKISQTVEGRKTKFAYDNEGNLLSQIDALGNTCGYLYDKDYNLICEVNPNGSKTTYEYDKNGNLTKTIDALGNESVFEYDNLGNKLKEIAPDGAEKTYGYDELGRLVKVTDPGKTFLYYEYDSFGNVVKETLCDEKDYFSTVTGEPSRKVCEYRYAKTGDLLSYGSFGEIEESYEYYPGGMIKSINYPSGKSISFEYDAFGNNTRIYHNGTLDVSRTFNEKGELIRQVDSISETLYSYDDFGNLLSIESNSGNVEYSYDIWGNKESVKYPNGSIVRYEYDDLNRPSKVVSPDKTETTFTYDACSNQVSKSTSSGISTITTYDAIGRILSIKNTNGSKLLSEFLYSYDKAGRLYSETFLDDEKALYKAYGYDEAGKLTKYLETDNKMYIEDDFLDAFRKSSLFDDHKKEVSANDVSDNSLSFSDVSFNEDSVKTYKGLKIVSYEYDTFGNKTKELSYNNGEKTEVGFSYDKQGRMEKKTLNKKVSETYKYDKDGNLIEKKEGARITSYSYTVENMLKSTAVNGDIVESINYDGTGLKKFSLLRKEYSDTVNEEAKEIISNNNESVYKWQKFFNEETTSDTNEFSEISLNPSVAYSKVTGTLVDEKMMDVAYVVGSFAPLFFEKWIEFAKSFCEDIKELFVYEGESSKSTAVSENDESDESNSSSKLITRILTNTVNQKPQASTHDETVVYYESSYYVYDLTMENPAVLCEESSPGVVKDAYIYSQNERVSSLRGDTYIYDARGSVNKILNNKKITASFEYDPYGNITKGAPAQDRVWAYNGEEYTPQTGFIYLRARNYNPSLGIFISKDTYLGDKVNPITKNRYVYANDNPVMYADPSGHKGLASKIVSAVKTVTTKVSKTVQKAVSSVQTKATTKATSSGAKAGASSGASAVKKATATAVTGASAAIATVSKTATTKSTSAKKTNNTNNNKKTSSSSTNNSANVSVNIGNIGFGAGSIRLTEPDGSGLNGLGLAYSALKNYIFNMCENMEAKSADLMYIYERSTIDAKYYHTIYAGEYDMFTVDEKGVWCKSFATSMKSGVGHVSDALYGGTGIDPVSAMGIAIFSSAKATIDTVFHDIHELIKPALRNEKVRDVIRFLDKNRWMVRTAFIVGDAVKIVSDIIAIAGAPESGGLSFALAAGGEVASAAIKKGALTILADAGIGILYEGATEVALYGLHREVNDISLETKSKVSEVIAKRPELSGTNREKLLSTVQDNRLAKFINEVYRPGAKVGDGGTADMLISEFYEGSSKHLTKAIGRLNEINRIIKSGSLSFNDLDIAEAIRDDLEYAIMLFK